MHEWGQIFNRDKAGGMKGSEIGRLLDVDRSLMSQEQKRLRDRIEKDKKLKQLAGRIEIKLSQLKI